METLWKPYGNLMETSVKPVKRPCNTSPRLITSLGPINRLCSHTPRFSYSVPKVHVGLLDGCTGVVQGGYGWVGIPGGYCPGTQLLGEGSTDSGAGPGSHNVAGVGGL